jgi:hypothetical protein
MFQEVLLVLAIQEPLKILQPQFQELTHLKLGVLRGGLEVAIAFVLTQVQEVKAVLLPEVMRLLQAKQLMYTWAVLVKALQQVLHIWGETILKQEDGTVGVRI